MLVRCSTAKLVGRNSLNRSRKRTVASALAGLAAARIALPASVVIRHLPLPLPPGLPGAHDVDRSPSATDFWPTTISCSPA